MTSSRMPFCQGTCTTVAYSIAAMVTYLCRHPTYDSRGAWHTVHAMFSRIISEMLPEVHTMEKCDFLKSITHSRIINSL